MSMLCSDRLLDEIIALLAAEAPRLGIRVYEGARELNGQVHTVYRIEDDTARDGGGAVITVHRVQPATRFSI